MVSFVVRRGGSLDWVVVGGERETALNSSPVWSAAVVRGAAEEGSGLAWSSSVVMVVVIVIDERMEVGCGSGLGALPLGAAIYPATHGSGRGIPAKALGAGLQLRPHQKVRPGWGVTGVERDGTWVAVAHSFLVLTFPVFETTNNRTKHQNGEPSPIDGCGIPSAPNIELRLRR